jgi:hypothetical protein
MPKTETDFPLTMTQVNALLQLALRTYHTQADQCFSMNAPVAGCIMAGATVEAVLTAVTCLLFDEALKTGKIPKYKHGKRKGENQDLLDWQFSHLLKVAKKAKWLPKQLTLDETLDRRIVKSPVPTNSIRQVRHLVHPALYLKNRSGKEYTLDELQTLYATCQAAYDCLIKELCRRYPNLPSVKSIQNFRTVPS